MPIVSALRARASEQITVADSVTRLTLALRRGSPLPEQVAIIRELFGRVGDDGNRAYRVAYVSMARKEGKTVQPGALKRGAFYFFARRDSSANQAVFRVTYRRKTAFYAPWVEYGHRIVARFKGKYTDYPVRGKGRLTGLSQRRRASTGRVPPHPWFEAAARSAAARTIDVQVEAGELEVRKIVNERT